MLVIRLSRVGRKKYATYRLLAQDSRRATAGKFLAILGNYNPHTKKAELKIEEIEKYLKSGAQPSGAVVRLLKAQKVKLPKWAESNLKLRKKAPKTKQKDGEEAEKQADSAKPDSAPADEIKEVVEEKKTEEPQKPEAASTTEADSASEKAPEEAKEGTKEAAKTDESKAEAEQKDVEKA